MMINFRAAKVVINLEKRNFILRNNIFSAIFDNLTDGYSAFICKIDCFYVIVTYFAYWQNV